jgi:hypothetical protein
MKKLPTVVLSPEEEKREARIMVLRNSAFGLLELYLTGGVECLTEDFIKNMASEVRERIARLRRGEPEV